MTWKITIKTSQETIQEEVDSLSNIQKELHGKIQCIKAETQLSLHENDVLFFNGYQTWTYNKELHTNDRQKGIHHIPTFLLKKYHFDCYGDYHFVDYPNHSGAFHGFTYMYIRHENTYHLFASCDEENAYTIFSYDHGTLRVERDCKDYIVNGTFTCFDIIDTTGNEEEVFDTWFNHMQIHPLETKKLYGYSSWYNHYENISSKTIAEDLEGCKKILQEGDLFQIDDGWQTCTGDWLSVDQQKFPKGLEYEVAQIHNNGFQAGIWLSPFLASIHSDLVKLHPDWLLKHNDLPWFTGCNWNGAYALDIDHPEVIQYLKDVFHQIFEVWKFDFVKLDFLYAGAPFATKHQTRSQKMYKGIHFLRQLCKNHPILGCGVPTCTTFGVFEYNRIGCDVSLDWNDVWYMRFFHRERTSTKQSLANTIFRRSLNNRAFLNDPDVFFLRDENIKLNKSQKDLLATLNALLGGVFLTSDNPSNYTEKQIEQYKYYRHLSQAENIHTIIHGSTLTITYTLDEKEHTFACDTTIF